MSVDRNALPLEKRPFGRTGLVVTPICAGCAELGSMPDAFAYTVAEEEALATVRAALQSPINFLDTSNIYGDSERRIGIVLHEMGGLPPGYVLATKADRDAATGDFGGDQMKRSIEQSLTRLGLDRLPIVYLHDPENSSFESIAAPGGALGVLLRYREQGVIAHLGVAGGPIDLLIRYVETGAFECVISHNRYTLLYRAAEPLFDLAASRGLAVVNAAPYGSGILAKGPAAYARYMYRHARPQEIARVDYLDDLCQRYGVPLAAVALQFSLRDPRITSTIVGMSRPQRIGQTLALAALRVPPELWEELAALPPLAGDPRAVA